MTGTGMPRAVLAGKRLPSGRDQRLTTFPARRCTASSTPHKMPHGHPFGRVPAVTSATTRVRSFPPFFRMSSVRRKYTSVVRPSGISSDVARYKSRPVRAPGILSPGGYLLSLLDPSPLVPAYGLLAYVPLLAF